LHLKIKPIGVIKKSSSGVSDILIYSDFERIIGGIIGEFEKGANLLIVHKNHMSLDGHQVQVSNAQLINRKGNLLTVKGIEADNDSLIDVRLKN